MLVVGQWVRVAWVVVTLEEQGVVLVGELRSVVVTVGMERGILEVRGCTEELVGVFALALGEPGVGEFLEPVCSSSRWQDRRLRQEAPLVPDLTGLDTVVGHS